MQRTSRLLTLGEEVAFRGYGFQRFALVVGSSGAAFGFALFYAIMRAHSAGIDQREHSDFSGLQLSAYHGLFAYRALWVSWGINFALEGVAGADIRAHGDGRQQPLAVIEGNPMGPFWLPAAAMESTRAGGRAWCFSLRFRSLYQGYPRPGFPLQRPRNRARRNPGGSGWRRPPTTRDRDGTAAEPAAPSLVQILAGCGNAVAIC